MKREEISDQFKWKMEDLYANEALWEADYQKVLDAIPSIKSFAGSLGESAEQLCKMQQMYDDISLTAERLHVYANQRLHQNTADAYYQGLVGRVQVMEVQLMEATSYIMPEILAIPEETLKEMLKSDVLAKYRTYFNRILRKKAHVLSSDMEELLAGAREVGEGPSDIFMMFNNADIKFPTIKDENGNDVEITHGRYGSLMESQDRRVREETFKGIYDSYGKFINTIAATYRANVKQECFFAKARKYPSSLAAALDQSAIPVSVYDNLIESVHKFLPALHKYVSIRKQKMGVEELHMYDLYVPLIGDVDKKIPYEEAKKIVLEGLKPLGEDYQALLQEGFDNGWIDVYENEGKRSGAYSWGAYGTHPYVLLNYQDSLNNTFTLAHEMGHALHSYHSDAAQDFIYAGYKIFVAEVASTCNEALLIHYLLEKTEDKKEKAYLINYFLDQFKGTLYRQTMFAEFEMMTHDMVKEGKTLTAQVLCDTYRELNKKYFGQDMVIDDEIAYEWARIPHFYTPFYVYQYATGFSAAIAISSRILNGEEGAVEDYKRFLSGGSSMSPIELLKLCKVDMTSGKPVQKSLEVFREYLEMLKQI